MQRFYTAGLGSGQPRAELRADQRSLARKVEGVGCTVAVSVFRSRFIDQYGHHVGDNSILDIHAHCKLQPIAPATACRLEFWRYYHLRDDWHYDDGYHEPVEF